MPDARIGDIVRGKREITPDMALRLGRYFGNGSTSRQIATSAAKELAERIAREVTPMKYAETVEA